MLFEGLSERGREVEGAAGGGSGIAIRLVGEARSDLFHTIVSTRSTNTRLETVGGGRKEKKKRTSNSVVNCA